MKPIISMKHINFPNTNLHNYKIINFIRKINTFIKRSFTIFVYIPYHIASLLLHNIQKNNISLCPLNEMA